MSSTSLGNKQCILCNKIGGILTCDGCQQAFCGKHVIEHRQQLTTELESIMQEHDLIRQDIELTKNNPLALEQINKWERESVAKIQVAAQKVRAALQQILENSNEQLSKTCRDIASKLRVAREAENFSETDLIRWTKKLNELKLQAKSLSMIHTVEDHSSVVHFLKIKQNSTVNTYSTDNDLLSSRVSLPLRTEERFAESSGLATLCDGGLCATHIDNDYKFVYFRGQQLYAEGRHTLKFKIERNIDPHFHNIFIGICTSDIVLRKILYHITAVVGWFNNTEVWQHGKCYRNVNLDKHNNDTLKTNDVVELTLDCVRKQIELFHERTKQKHTIDVDPLHTSLPWKVLLVLRRKNDSVKILNNN